MWFTDREVAPQCRAGRFDYVVERTWKARDDCGNVSSCVQEIHVLKTPVVIDAIPGACPNVVSLDSCTPVKIAILGSATFNVCDVVASSVKLYGKDCDGGPIPAQCAVRTDVSSPGAPDGWTCQCVDQNQDGFADLVLYFQRSHVVNSLGLCDLPDGANLQIALIGKLRDGCRFIGVDCLQVP